MYPHDLMIACNVVLAIRKRWFAIGGSSTFAFDPFGPEVALIDFHLTAKGGPLFTELGQLLTNHFEESIDSLSVPSR